MGRMDTIVSIPIRTNKSKDAADKRKDDAMKKIFGIAIIAIAILTLGSNAFAGHRGRGGTEWGAGVTVSPDGGVGLAIGIGSRHSGAGNVWGGGGYPMLAQPRLQMPMPQFPRGAYFPQGAFFPNGACFSDMYTMQCVPPGTQFAPGT
jgi:hypothetical protein